MPTPPPDVSYEYTQLVHLPKGGPTTPPSVTTPMPPPVINRRFLFLHFPGGAPATPSSIGAPTPPLAVFYRRTQYMYLPGGGSCHAFLRQHAFAASDNLYRRTQVVYATEVGHPHASLHLQCPRRLTTSSTGAPSWCICRKGPLLRLLPSPRPYGLRSSTGDFS